MSTKILHCSVTLVGAPGTPTKPASKLWAVTSIEDPSVKVRVGTEHEPLDREKRFTPVENGPLVFERVLGEQHGRDLRANPPFYTILPCPYCDCTNDREHDPLKHVDDRLGTPWPPKSVTIE